MPPYRRQLAAGAFLTLWAASATAETVEEEACARQGRMTWAFWRDSVLEMNPGTDTFELTGIQRANLLRALECRPAEGCAPDSVHVFYCVGNSMVLIGFEEAGCATRAEEMSIEDYHSMLGAVITCGAQ